MKPLYLCSTLKADWNREFNLQLGAKLERAGIGCYLPQRDTRQTASAEEIWTQNTSAIRSSKLLLAVAKNVSLNWGVEVGLAYGLAIPVIALTDNPSEIPLMAAPMVELFRAERLDDLDNYFERLMTSLRRRLG